MRFVRGFLAGALLGHALFWVWYTAIGGRTDLSLTVLLAIALVVWLKRVARQGAPPRDPRLTRVGRSGLAWGLGYVLVPAMLATLGVLA